MRTLTVPNISPQANWQIVRFVCFNHPLTLLFIFNIKCIKILNCSGAVAITPFAELLNIQELSRKHVTIKYIYLIQSPPPNQRLCRSTPPPPPANLSYDDL